MVSGAITNPVSDTQNKNNQNVESYKQNKSHALAPC